MENGTTKIENDMFGFVNITYELEIDNIFDVVYHSIRNVDSDRGRNLKVELTIFATYCDDKYINESKINRVYYLRGDLTNIMKIITDNIIDYIEHCKVR